MAGNPFLAMNEEFVASPENPALNPFLTGDFGGATETFSDNPFAGSNPFSDFGATDFISAAVVTTGVDFFGISDPVATTAANFFSTTIHDAYEQPGAEPLFSTASTINPTNIVTSANFFDTTIQEQHSIPTTAPSIQKPTDLGLIITNASGGHDDMSSFYSSDDESKPRRPPPPSRPIAPETKDLILSVTGHMELTSTHLLDRIPPTRTPSPVSMRDLHSPSPTPDQVFGDFLTDGDAIREPTTSDEAEVNLFDMDDVVTQYSCSPQHNSTPPADVDLLSNQANTATIEHVITRAPPPIPSRETSPKEENRPDVNQNKPPRPGPSVRPTPPRPPPSRPMPPQKPPPPTVLPQRPPPIVPMSVVPNQPYAPPTTASNDFNLFDAPPAPAAPGKSSNQDILNLYAPKKQVEPVKQIDFLTDDYTETMPSQPEANITPVENVQAEIKIPEPAELDKPQPMDITPIAEDIPPSDQMVIDPINAATVQEPSIPQENIPATQISEEQPFAVQPTITNVENSFNAPEVVSEPAYNPQSIFGVPAEEPQQQADLNTHMPESNPFGVPDDSSVMFSNTIEEVPTQVPNIFGLDSTQNNNAFDYSSSTNNAFDDSITGNAYDNSALTNNAFDNSATNTAFEESDASNAFDNSAVAANAFDNSAVAASAFGNSNTSNAFGGVSAFGAEPAAAQYGGASSGDAFDAFSAKFDSTGNKEGGGFDAFGGSAAGAGAAPDDAWGNAAAGFSAAPEGDGFGVDDSFDAFLTLHQPPPVPAGTPAQFSKADSQDSGGEEGNFNVFIKPREGDVPFDSSSYGGVVPVLAPPPKSPAQAFTDTSPRFNPFDKSANFAEAAFGAHQENAMQSGEERTGMQRTDSQETPPTPLFDEDTSQPLEDFPRIHYEGQGWEVQLRQPNKKKITGQRFWKKIFVKLVYQGDNPVVQLFNAATDKEPFQELPLQACYSVSDIAAQQYDQYGKIFTVKLQYVFYKERPGVRPGQVTKAERITNKLSQFAAYAIQGDYQGCKEFGSDLKKLGLPVEHAPQVSQLFKIGSTTYEDMKQFSMCIEEALFRINAHRDRALHYKMEEVQITGVDELYVEQDAEGHIMKQIARVRLFFLGFLSGMPDVELGVNDMWRQGKEVVGRHDIIPVATEEWIRLEGVEFHSCVQPDEYQRTRIIRFKPPDACYIELMRFRIRPPKNRELPLQLKAVMCVTGNKVELRADALVPGFTSRSLGQVPCEDVMIRFPIPECWIYLFRVEKHFRYGSVKSAHRRTGKIKGIERFLGAVDTLQESLIEVTSGQAKYEHQHRSIVWRMSRLPKEGQGAYTTHNLVCRMALTSYDQIPEKLAEWCYVEFTMPATQASHTTVRSVSLQNHDSDDPPEKYVRYLARHEYKVGIEHTQGEGPNAYSAATISKPVIKEEPVQEVEHTPAPPSSDSDSD